MNSSWVVENHRKNPMDLPQLAEQYANGELEAECDIDLVQLFKYANDGKDPKVLYRLGMCYHYGWGTVKDLNAAVECYGRAAELGSFEALERLWDFQNKQSMKICLWNAFRGFCEKAEQGNARAQFNAGFCHFYGIGTPDGKGKARDLFQMAADQGCADAMWMLDCCREKGFGDGYNGMEEIKLWKYAAELGSAEAENQLGFAYYYGKTSYGLKIEKDYKQAAEWYQKAAGQNHTEATHRLAWCYYNGEGVKRDIKKAFQLFRKAALMGNERAQYYISDFDRHKMPGLSENDYPVDIDFYEAAYWNWKAVDEDNDYAKKSMPDILRAIGLTPHQIDELMKQTNSFESAKIWYDIAKEYETGDGVEKDEQKAFEMYKLAARLGNTEGQVALARCYEEGIGTEKNIPQSICWNIRAAMQGNIEATSTLEKQLEQKGRQIALKYPKLLLKHAIEVLKEPNMKEVIQLKILQHIIESQIEGIQPAVVPLIEFFNRNQEPPESVETFEMCKLAVEYDIKAVYWMVKHSEHSTNIVEDFAGLPQLLEVATDSGDAEITCCLARCYMLGLGIPKNEIEAFNCYQFAVEEGHAAAEYELGCCYENGIATGKDCLKAVELYEKAADENYVPALRTLVKIYKSEMYLTKEENHVFKYSTLSELDDGDEQLRIAKSYKYGDVVEQNDKEALYEFERAAANGKYESYEYIAECYDKGIGTELNLETAFIFYKQLATVLPTKENLVKLAERLENGIGAEKDVEAAIEHYEQAKAYDMLGDMYYAGKSVNRSLEIALSYYGRAEQFNLVELLRIICIYTIRQLLRGDGFFFFKILKLTASSLRAELCQITIDVE